MRWHKLISIILHPIVMPTIGILLYFILAKPIINQQIQYRVLTIIFVTTYIASLILLVVLKRIGYIKNLQLSTIEERKIPLFFMTTLFFVLGKSFYGNYITREISYLFYGTALSLTIIYFIFFFKVKTSLHLVSIGNALGFFMILQQVNNRLHMMLLIVILVVLSGILASSRLYLKAHTPKEVYLGFFTGILSQFVIHLIL